MVGNSESQKMSPVGGDTL